MIIIRNNIIPFKGFAALNFFEILFVRKDVTDTTIRHESIHTAQMRELLYIGFYIWYILEWLFLLFKYKFQSKEAYYNIRFEKEAYKNQDNPDYLKQRKHFNYLWNSSTN